MYSIIAETGGGTKKKYDQKKDMGTQNVRYLGIHAAGDHPEGMSQKMGEI